MDGIPDSCSAPLIASPFCFCPVGICGNADPNAGCANSTGVGAFLEGFNSSSVAMDDLVLRCTQLPINQWGIIFRGTATIPALPFGDGYRCVGGALKRFPPKNSGALGEFSYGPGIVAASALGTAPILAGSTWNFQAWYRNLAGPCSNNFNLSNGLSVLFY